MPLSAILMMIIAALILYGGIAICVRIALKKNRSSTIDDIIEGTVATYGETITRLYDQGFSVCIHGIPPAAKKTYTSVLPYTGSPEERVYISRRFNEQLKEYCHSKNIPYLDVQSISKNEEGFIREEYAADELHLNANIVPFIRERIAEAFDSRFPELN